MGSEPVKGYASALRVLEARNVLQTPQYQEKHWLCNREGAHPKMLLLEKVAISRFEKLGIPMYVPKPCFVRTAEEQHAAFLAGNSKLDAGHGPHEFGCAFDLVHVLKGWDLDPKSWDMVRHIVRELAVQNSVPLAPDITWDPAHFELLGWHTIKDAFPFDPPTR